MLNVLIRGKPLKIVYHFLRTLTGTVQDVGERAQNVVWIIVSGFRFRLDHSSRGRIGIAHRCQNVIHRGGGEKDPPLAAFHWPRDSPLEPFEPAQD